MPTDRGRERTWYPLLSDTVNERGTDPLLKRGTLAKTLSGPLAPSATLILR